MTYVEARFKGADEAMMCEKKLQAIRIPHVEMTENMDSAVNCSYVLSADIPEQLQQLAHSIIRDHSGSFNES